MTKVFKWQAAQYSDNKLLSLCFL